MEKKERCTLQAKQKYPKWVDEFARSRFNSSTYANPSVWGPVDSFALPRFYESDFIDKVYEAVSALKQKKVSNKQAAQAFLTSSAVRTAISFLLIDYSWAAKKDKGKFREIMEFLVGILKERNKEDLFTLRSNIAHSQEGIEKIIKNVNWQEGTTEVARTLGQLTVSLYSLVFALFGDFYPQDANEVYGPYDVAKGFGKAMNLILRHFPEIDPVELWPNTKNFKYSEIKIYLIYQDVQYRMMFLGMHCYTEGDLIKGLKKYAVEVDGKWYSSMNDLINLKDYFAKLAVEQSQILEGLALEELKVKALEWAGYQLKGLFELAGMDWKPEEEMIQKIKGKKVARKLESNWTPTWEQFCKSKRNDYSLLKDLYS